jgi:RNA polymerase sigma factor (sigma-70 family)
VATAQMNTVIRHLRRAVLMQDGADRMDGELLASFIDEKDEAAFEALVRRHGPMVLSVCHRIVRNHHDAEDAFQATFLVLARKASSIRPRAMVANWLHGVACRTAMKAKTMTAKRRVRETNVTQMPESEAAPQDQWHDLQPVIDQELSGLPENYRLPIILCDLEGKSIKDATQQLGWPQGTLAGRLARARKLLAKRLTQRGVVLSGGALAVVLAEKAASASVSLALAVSTTMAAVAVAAGQAAAPSLVSAKVAILMEGVIKGMLLTKLKTVAVVLLALCVVAFGGGLLQHQRATGQQSNAQKEDAKPKDRKSDVSTPDNGKKNDFRVEVVPGTQAQRYSASFQEGKAEQKVEQPPSHKADPAKNKAEAPNQGEPAKVVEVEYTQPYSLPSGEEVLKAMPKGQALPRNLRIRCELVAFRLQPPRFFPIVGQAQLATAHFKCTVASDQSKEVVVYIDKDKLIAHALKKPEGKQGVAFPDFSVKATEGKRFVVPMALDFGFPVKPMALDFGLPVTAAEGKRFIVPVVESQEEYRVPLMESRQEFRVPVIVG